MGSEERDINDKSKSRGIHIEHSHHYGGEGHHIKLVMSQKNKYDMERKRYYYVEAIK
jgi:hypothetical protein